MTIDSDTSDSNAHIPVAESESQPTPPPRTKKLKKKLEVLVEQKLNEKLIEGSSQSSNNEEHSSDVKQVSNVQVEGSENAHSNSSEYKASSAGEESNLIEVKGSPPKSRRRKKHMQ